MKKKKINLPVKPVVLSTIIFIAAFLIVRYIMVSLKNLDYFRIKEITLGGAEEKADFSYLIGRSIFNVDLKKESRYITEIYPAHKNIRLFRILPDRLSIVFTERDPLAYVKLYRNFYVDREGVFFSPVKGDEALYLPVIRGLDKKIRAPKEGRRYDIKELITALAIIEHIGSNSYLKQYKIDRIDISDAANISFFILIPRPVSPQARSAVTELEIRMAQVGEISDKIDLLAGLLSQSKEDVNNIKYIDLRFKEPVVKLKDAK